MKTWKLVSGVLSIVLCLFVLFQSCAAGISNTIQENGEVGGSAGVIVAIMLLAGGIVSIATRNGSKGGNIAVIVLYRIGALFGFTLAGSYSDLVIWAAWCLICVVLPVIPLIKTTKRKTNNVAAKCALKKGVCIEVDKGSRRWRDPLYYGNSIHSNCCFWLRLT